MWYCTPRFAWAYLFGGVVKSLELFLKYVTIHVSGCSDPLAVQALASSANEFCKLTHQAQLLEAQSLTAGQQNYEVPSATSSDHICVIGVFAGAWLKPVTTEQVRLGEVLLGSSVGSSVPALGSPTHYFMRSPEATEISLFPVPSQDVIDGLVIRTAYAPSLSSTSVPDHLFNRWNDAIVAGALYRLFGIPGHPWSSEKQSEKNKNLFYTEVRKAHAEARRGMAAASSRVIGPRF